MGIRERKKMAELPALFHAALLVFNARLQDNSISLEDKNSLKRAAQESIVIARIMLEAFNEEEG